MRRLIAAIMCIAWCLTCEAFEKEGTKWKRSIGVDLGCAICEGGLKIGISQQFAEQWSIEANQKILLKMVQKNQSEEIRNHYNTLYYENMKTEYVNDEFMTGEAKVSYWISQAYKGPYIQSGCRIGTRQKPSCILGIGYAIRIWRGMTCTLSYDTSITHPIQVKVGLTFSYVY